MKLLLIYFLLTKLNIILACIYSENIECSCTEDVIECSGAGENSVEMQQLFVNISLVHSTRYLESLVLNVTNLTLPNDTSHIDLEIRNLSLIGGLQDITVYSFTGLWTSLKHLRIQNNSIEFVGNKSFVALYNLTELYLDSNKISEIQSDAFLDLNKLEILSLSGNQLSKLGEDFLINLPVLKTISLNNNNFSFLSNVGIVSSSLSKLSAQNCHIEGLLEEESLSGVSHLTYIDLSLNNLQGVNSHALSSLSNIKALNLSKNIIEYLHEYAFSKMSTLVTLDLSWNKITMIKTTAFNKLSNVHNIDLSSNRLQAMLCDYTSDMHSLELMDLRNNRIKTINAGTFLYSPNIQGLYLEGNALDEVDAVICSPLPNITIMFVDIDFQSKNCEIPEPCERFALEKEDNTTDYDYFDMDNDTTFSTTNMNEFTTDEIKKLFESTSLATGAVEENTITEYEVNHSSAISSTHLSNLTTYTTIVTEEITDDSSPKISTRVSNLTTTTDTFSITTLMNVITDNDTDQTSVISPTHLNAFSTTIDTILISTNESEIMDSTSPISSTHSSDLTTTGATSPSNTTIRDEITVYDTDNGSTIFETYLSDLTTAETIPVKTTDSTSPISSTHFIELTMTENNTASNSVSTAEHTTIITNTARNSVSTAEPTTIITTNMTLGISSVSTTDETKFIASSTIPTKASSNAVTISVMDYTFTSKKFCFDWKFKGALLKGQKCSLRYSDSSGGRKSLHIKCPKLGKPVYDCVNISEINDFCIMIYIEDKIRGRYCSKVHLSTTEALSDVFSTTESVFTPTSTAVFPTDATTDKTTILNSDHSIKPKPSHIPFGIVSFNVSFNDSNSVMAVWSVNRYESMTLCNLTLSLHSAMVSHTQVFICANGSYQMKNLKERDSHKICLISQHTQYGNETKCKQNSALFQDASASKRLDHGYKNSSLFAVSLLLLLVLAVIIFIVLRSLLKKRFDRDRYNVYIEEQNVQKRVSSILHEPSVRFSYIPKEEN